MMKISLLLFFPILVLFSCADKRQTNTTKHAQRELVPEPDKAERLRYEAIEKLRNSDCIVLSPDTSVLSLILREAGSGKRFIGDYKPGQREEYRYYSKNYQQELTLKQHPGDAEYQISVITVRQSRKEDYGYRRLDVDTISTGKGIMIGMSKEELIRRLGTCYAVPDSSNEYIELYYRIESPKDSESHLLARHNMPVYYASYKFRKNWLERFEFGFEYP